MENIKLRFGKYKNCILKDIPDSYLKWALDNNIFKGKILLYIKTRLKAPKDTFQVTVEDSVTGDGTYTVKAYNSNQAIKVAKKENHIQNTQSFCGTIYSVKKLKV